MRLLRVIVAVAALGAAALAVYRWCYIPYRFNVAKRVIELDLLRAVDLPDEQRAALIARRNLERLANYRTTCRSDLDLYMDSAIGYRILGRRDQAIATYQTALAMHRRPEIFFNLGIVQIEAGNREQGIENLVNAIRFHPEAGYISDPQIAAEVHRRVHELRQAARNR